MAMDLGGLALGVVGYGRLERRLAGKNACPTGEVFVEKSVWWVMEDKQRIDT